MVSSLRYPDHSGSPILDVYTPTQLIVVYGHVQRRLRGILPLDFQHQRKLLFGFVPDSQDGTPDIGPYQPLQKKYQTIWTTCNRKNARVANTRSMNKLLPSSSEGSTRTGEIQ
jgi:hypothetical protein